MDYDVPVDETALVPATPEVIRQQVLRNLRGLYRIVVEEEVQKSRFAKRNALAVGGPRDGEEPEDELETLCEGVMRIFHGVCAAREDEDPVRFRLMFETKTKDGERKRPSFRYTYDEADADLDPDVGDEYDQDARLDAFVTAVQVRDSFIDKILLRLDEAHIHIINQSRQTENTIKPIMDAYAVMGGMYASGLHMQQHALALIYDVKRGESETKADAAKHERTLKFLEKPLTVAMKQAMAFASAKTGVPLDMDVEEDEEEEEEERKEGTRAEGAPVEVTVQEPAPELDEEEAANPLAVVCRELGNTLTGAQWFKITDALRTKKNVRTLRSVLTAATDADAVKAYAALEALDLEVLLAVNQALDPEQQQAISALGKMIEALKEQQDAQS